MGQTAKFKQIIFIDEENTGLSAFAARLMEKKLLLAGVYDVRATSRGTVVLFPEPANPKASEMAAQYGISLNAHRAMQIEDDVFADDTLVLAMDSASKQKVSDRYQNARNIYSLKEYLGEVGDVYFPIGEPVEKYAPVCETLDRLLELLLGRFVPQEEKPENSGK